MSRERKRKFSWFLAWNYDSEEDSLNHYSERGWRLEEVHTFHKVYVRDEDQYRYRIDFKNKFIDYDDKKRYIETFEEMGWHYVGAIFNGWQYFEKKVEETNTEEDYNIYTDSNSLKDTLHRWIRVARICELAVLLITFMNLSNYIRGVKVSMTLVITTLIEFVLFEFGIISMKRKQLGVKKSKSANIIVGNVLFISMIACLVLGVTSTFGLLSHQPLVQTKMQGVFLTDKPDDKFYFVVKDKGWYNIDADCTSEFGTITFKILEGSNEIYQTSGSPLKIDQKLKLEEGAYRAVIEIDYGEEVPEENFYSVDLNIN